MILEGLIPVTCRRRVNTTNSNHDLEVISNLLKSDNNPSGINQVWVSDMTYIQTDEGRQY